MNKTGDVLFEKPGLGIFEQLEVWLWNFYRAVHATENVDTNDVQESFFCNYEFVGHVAAE